MENEKEISRSPISVFFPLSQNTTSVLAFRLLHHRHRSYNLTASLIFLTAKLVLSEVWFICGVRPVFEANSVTDHFSCWQSSFLLVCGRAGLDKTANDPRSLQKHRYCKARKRTNSSSRKDASTAST